LELLSELLQSLIGLEKPLLKKLPLCMTIPTSRTEHRAAQDKAGDQACENPGDEEKDRSQESAAVGQFL
jgi:hypothetical protein